MSNKIQIIKRLEVVKNLIELEDEDAIHTQIEKLKAEKNEELDKIITILENDDYSFINDAIDDYVYGFKNAKLTPHQQVIFDGIVKDMGKTLAAYKSSGSNYRPDSHECFFSLSGSAGTGKTFLTSKLVEEFTKREYKILLTTPTHKSLSVAKYMINSSNIHVHAKTLQSYLDLRLKENLMLGTKSFKRDKTQDMRDYEKNLDILIVDESSMVSNELLGFIEENLEQNKLKTVLFIGDQYQLPPVDEGTNGVVILPKQYKLTEIVRQAKDSYIKVIANELKECIKTRVYTPIHLIFNTKKYPQLTVFDNLKDYLEDFTSGDKWYAKNQAIAYTNAQIDEQNRLLRYRYWKEKGVEASEAILKGEMLIFNEGYNDGTFQNSEIVTVDSAVKEYDKYKNINYWKCIDTYGRTFKVVDFYDEKDYNDYLRKVANEANAVSRTKRVQRRKKWAHYFASKDEYAKVKYVFASTIHKSQGSTYENTYISASSIISLTQRKDEDMAYRLLYVAVTRASKQIKVLM